MRLCWFGRFCVEGFTSRFREVDVIARLETDACLRVVAFHKPVIGDEIPVVIGICAEPRGHAESTYRKSTAKQASISFSLLTPNS